MSDSNTTAVVDVQPDLPAVEWPVFFNETVEKEGLYTGEQYQQRHPERYRAIIELLAAGIGILKIRRMTGAHPKTIQAIRDANPQAIEIGKQRLARLLRYIGTLAAESLAEDFENGEGQKFSPQQRAVIMAIAIEKAQLMEGSPTAIVGKPEQSAPTHEDFLRYIESLPRAQLADGARETGLGQRGSAPKGSLPAGAGVDPDGPAAGPGADQDSALTADQEQLEDGAGAPESDK